MARQSIRQVQTDDLELSREEVARILEDYVATHFPITNASAQFQTICEPAIVSRIIDMKEPVSGEVSLI